MKQLILFLCLIFCGVASQTYATQRCKSIQFEKLDSISVKDLHRLTNPIMRFAHGSLSFSFFDEEGSPSKNNTHAIGFVIASLGDLDETPVAGYLWTDIDIKPKLLGKQTSEKPGTEGDGPVTMKFSVPKSKDCPEGIYMLSLQKTGDFVADGTIVGTVK